MSEETDDKYELTGRTRWVDGTRVHQIRARRRVGQYHPGTVGGWIESERNLTQGDDQAWIGDDAVVVGSSRVREMGHVTGEAIVRGSCLVTDRGFVGDEARLDGRVRVRDHATAGGRAQITGDVELGDYCRVGGRARLSGSLRLIGDCGISGDAVVGGDLELRDARIGGLAEITEPGHVVVLSGLTDDLVIVYRAPGQPGGHRVTVGCQTFTLSD